MQNTSLKRRDAVKATAAGAAFMIVPRYVLGQGKKPPSEKLNIASVGVGGKGASDVAAAASVEGGNNIVALVDVDERRAGGTYKKFPNAKRFKDYRKMLDAMGDSVDAVTVTTPDHMHFPIAMAAMERGKHVFVQKPMAHTVWEAREMTLAARKYKVATQMGIQGHASRETRLIKEWLLDGAIGDVREIHCWTEKPGRIWKQGVKRPQGTHKVPAGLDWNLWLGVAPERPYHPDYMPFLWRGYWDFGSCALGDMGCHILDHPVNALDLTNPVSVQAYSTPLNGETGPLASTIYYDFPARGKFPACRLSWYDGGVMPPWPEELESTRRRGNNEGVMFIGDKGKLMCGCYGNEARIVPESMMQAYERPPKTIPRSPGHMEEWIIACKGGEPAKANFDYSGPLTELVALGNVALRTSTRFPRNGHDTRIGWDAEKLVASVPDAEQYIKKQYRKF
jgi:predicted dehydrogenase